MGAENIERIDVYNYGITELPHILEDKSEHIGWLIFTGVKLD